MNMHSSDFDDLPEPRGGIPVPAAEPRRSLEPREEGMPGYPYGAVYEEPQSQFDLLKYWGLFLKHRWMIAAIVAVAMSLGFAKTYLTTPTYRATTTLEINREAQKIVTLGDDTRDATIEDAKFYETEYELLKSRSLAARVVADLDLANQPGFLGDSAVSPWTKLRRIIFGGRTTPQEDAADRKNAAIGRVEGGITVQPIPNSALVHLSFDDPSPTWAQRIVNAYAQAFIKINLERRYDATAYARNFLQDQLAQIKLKLENSERSLLAYAQKQKIVNLGGKAPPLADADLLAINSQLAQVRAQRIQNEQLWHQAETTDGLGLPQILADQTIQRLRDNRAALEATYQEKLNTFKPDFPDMLRLHAQIKEIDHQIKAAVDIIKQSIKAQYEASKQQEAMLEQQLSENKTQVLDSQGRDVQYAILQREVDTDRTLYNALLQRYKDVGVDGGVGTNNISVVDAALPGYKFSPNLKKNVGMALLLGLLAAAAAVYVLELLDDTYKTPEEVEESLRLPVLGLTPLLRDMDIDEALADPHSHFSESLRSVRTSLQFSTDSGVPKSLLLTSSHPSEGKSTTALALARNFAQLSMRVLLIDADLRKPSLHKMLGCDNGVGLSNYLVGGDTPGNIFRKTATPGLMFMPSGPLPPNPAELLAGPKLLSLLTFAHQKFDLIILDGPPIVGLADALLLGSVAAGTMMVVGACETPKNVVLRAIKRLHFARARLIGVLVNKFDAKKVGYEYGYAYSNYYYYSYGAEKGAEKPKLAPTAGD